MERSEQTPGNAGMMGALMDTAEIGARDAADLWAGAAETLKSLYGDTPGFADWLASIRMLVADALASRRPDLREWDETHAGWWRRPSNVGYSTYVDRFGGTLSGVAERLDYLQNLGVTYLHLLPLMKPRSGESDGGYAVADFEDVNPALGALADFVELMDKAREREVHVVTDLVCNHVADDHQWAQAARAGDPRYRDFFHLVPDEAGVRAWEADLLEVFPDSAPGNFTWSDEVGAWVWTSFYPYQWDLNYANPDVFRAMTSTLLNLANMGVSGFRLDSTGFLWKQAGTTCRNLPQVHQILAVWRALLTLVAPGVVLKAEAIDRLEEVLPFFGSPRRPECDLAYANGVMAGAWTALALGSAKPVRALIQAASARPPQAAWINYVRCHDDIIFSGLAPHVSAGEQREATARLIGEGPGGFGQGEIFQVFDGVPSLNGMAASLCGLQGDGHGEARLKLLYGLCFALDGTPVIYMGDEIGLENDESFRTDPERATEGRWLQRPAMDWELADGAALGLGPSARLHSAFVRYARIRARHPAFADTNSARVDAEQPEAVLSLRRGRGGEAVQVLANLSDRSFKGRVGLDRPWVDLLTGETGDPGDLVLAPYDLKWLAAR